MTDTRLEIVEYEFNCEDGPAGLFLVHRFTLVEELNQPYTLSLSLTTEVTDAAVGDFVGASVEVIVRRGQDRRAIYGIVTAAEHAGLFETRVVVNLRVEPAFSALRQRVTSRIFQGASVQDIVAEVLGVLGEYSRTFDPGSAARGTAARDYCVQYRESDYDFVTRLLEEEGISFAFTHDTGKRHEVLRLIYETSDCQPVANIDGTPTLPIISDRAEIASVESLSSFEWSRTMVPESVLRQDYDFLSPTEPLTENKGEADARGRTRRLYHHMARRFVADDVPARAQDHLEAATMPREVPRAESNVTALEPARYFELDRHANPDYEQAYVVTRVIHTAHCPEALIGSHDSFGDDAPRYRNRFECVPKAIPIRPEQRTPKPEVHGPQTAIVCGPAGEEIHTDEHGRILVNFHWDERAARDDTASCWLRVLQWWSGPMFGSQFIPRIGMEVLVVFLEGNPDRPLAVGCVYNGDNAPPFALPDNKTQSGLRTQTSPGGQGSNELRFEDAKGSEQIYVHAQKDWDSEVENNRTTYIKVNDTLTIDVDRTEEIGGKRTIHVVGVHDETLDDDMKLLVSKNQKIEVTQNRDEKITGNHSEIVDGAYTEKVGKAKTVTVGAAYEEQVQAARSIDAGGPLTLTSADEGKLECDKAIAISTGAKLGVQAADDAAIETEKKLTIKSGKDLLVDCGAKATFKVSDELVLECGSAKIVLKSGGEISIEGSDIKIKGSGDVVVKGSNVGAN